MPSKTLASIKCRCGHDRAQHKPLDADNLEWCRGSCGCAMFEPLNEPEPPHTPTFRGPLPEWVANILAGR